MKIIEVSIEWGSSIVMYEAILYSNVSQPIIKIKFRSKYCLPDSEKQWIMKKFRTGRLINNEI